MEGECGERVGDDISVNRDGLNSSSFNARKKAVTETARLSLRVGPA